MKDIIKSQPSGLFRLLLAMLLSTAILLPGNGNTAELKKLEKPIEPPALKLESLKGKKIDLGDYKGKVVLVQFWATYCSPCRTEMPSMNKLIKKLHDADIPFEILAVDMGESKDEVQKFVDEVKPEFSILLVDKDEQIEDWNVFATPTNFLIDTQGKIRYTLYGEFDWGSEAVFKTISELAAKSKNEGKDESEGEGKDKDESESEGKNENEGKDKGENKSEDKNKTKDEKEEAAPDKEEPATETKTAD